MQVTLQIPDELARTLDVDGDLSRRVVETLFAEEYRAGRISKPQLRDALGIETSYELDGFLKRHQIWHDYTVQDSINDQESLERLGL